MPRLPHASNLRLRARVRKWHIAAQGRGRRKGPLAAPIFAQGKSQDGRASDKPGSYNAAKRILFDHLVGAVEHRRGNVCPAVIQIVIASVQDRTGIITLTRVQSSGSGMESRHDLDPPPLGRTPPCSAGPYGYCSRRRPDRHLSALVPRTQRWRNELWLCLFRAMHVGVTRGGRLHAQRSVPAAGAHTLTP